MGFSVTYNGDQAEPLRGLLQGLQESHHGRLLVTLTHWQPNAVKHYRRSDTVFFHGLLRSETIAELREVEQNEALVLSATVRSGEDDDWEPDGYPFLLPIEHVFDITVH